MQDMCAANWLHTNIPRKIEFVKDYPKPAPARYEGTELKKAEFE
jgi:hypothetical protein